MRKFIKDSVLSILINAAILYGLSNIQFGIVITANSDPIIAYVLLGAIFWIVNFGLKKIVHVVSFPIKVLTLGLFGIIINIGVLYLFQWFINTNHADIAHVALSPSWVKVLILSIVISLAYALLSKLLK